jgi:hypothetical protein
MKRNEIRDGIAGDTEEIAADCATAKMPSLYPGNACSPYLRQPLMRGSARDAGGVSCSPLRSSRPSK